MAATRDTTLLRNPTLGSCDVLDQLGSVGVVLAYFVVIDGLFHEVTCLDARIDCRRCRVRPGEQRLAVDLGDHAPVQLHQWIRPNHLQIEDEPAGPDCLGHSTQDVHDVLRWHTSERPREDDEVERARRDLELVRRGGQKRDSVREIGRQHLPCLLDRFRIRIEREHVRGFSSEALREPAFTAPHL
jgi:hypothetical protein